MPVNVAVEEPDSGVIGDKAHDEIALWWEYQGVAASWEFGECGVIGRVVGDWVAISVVVEVTTVGRESLEHLEVVPVEVEGMRACITVVEDNFDN